MKKSTVRIDFSSSVYRSVHFSVRDSGVVKKRAVYLILRINKDGIKEVLEIYVEDYESSKYWFSIFNELKNRGLKDIIIFCADGLTGTKKTIEVAFPKSEYQRCIVHQVRNTFKYVSYKEKRIRPRFEKYLLIK
nr:transposase [Peptostreptococcus faecalis]